MRCGFFLSKDGEDGTISCRKLKYSDVRLVRGHVKDLTQLSFLSARIGGFCFSLAQLTQGSLSVLAFFFF